MILSHVERMNISELQKRFSSIVTLHPWNGKSSLTFTTFGACLADEVEVPCSIALGKLFANGWKSSSESRIEEMNWILGMLSCLQCLFWICEYGA